MRHVYLIEDSEKHWVAADLLGDAMVCWAGLYGGNLQACLNDSDPYIKINEVPGAKEISVSSEDGKSKQIRTAAQWAASFQRPTLICSTVW